MLRTTCRRSTISPISYRARHWICSSIELHIRQQTRRLVMAANAFVRARIDGNLKDEAAAVLAEMGLTVSDVVRMTLTRIAKDKALPFALKVQIGRAHV